MKYSEIVNALRARRLEINERLDALQKLLKIAKEDKAIRIHPILLAEYNELMEEYSLVGMLLERVK